MGQEMSLRHWRRLHDRRPRLAATVSPLLARCRRQERSRWIAAVLRWLRSPSMADLGLVLWLAACLAVFGHAIAQSWIRAMPAAQMERGACEVQ